MSKAGAWTAQQVLSGPTVDTILATSKITLGGAEGTIGSQSAKTISFTAADASATTSFTFSIPNVTTSIGVVVTFTCLHGDGTASHSGQFTYTIDRVAGATSVVTASTIASAVEASSTGAGAVTIAVTSSSTITGAVNVTQAVRLKYTATKTNGTSSSHPFAAECRYISVNNSGITLS